MIRHTQSNTSTTNAHTHDLHGTPWRPYKIVVTAHLSRQSIQARRHHAVSPSPPPWLPYRMHAARTHIYTHTPHGPHTEPRTSARTCSLYRNRAGTLGSLPRDDNKAPPSPAPAGGTRGRRRRRLRGIHIHGGEEVGARCGAGHGGGGCGERAGGRAGAAIVAATRWTTRVSGGGHSGGGEGGLRQ